MDNVDKVVLIVVVGILMSVAHSAANLEAREKRCIDDVLYMLTDNGYWLAYDRGCKAVTKPTSTQLNNA